MMFLESVVETSMLQKSNVKFLSWWPNDQMIVRENIYITIGLDTYANYS